MIINATAELYYNESRSMISYSESLVLIIKFKMEGKFFKVKLYKDLCTTHDYYRVNGKYATLDEYYADVKRLLNDDEYVKECAIGMVERYLEHENKENNDEKNKSDVVAMTKSKPKIEIKVEIK